MMDHRSASFLATTLFTVFAVLLCGTVGAADAVRVATYNIKYLSSDVRNQGDRLSRLRQVLERLDADVIGLQEIDDRAALAPLFPPEQWSVVIDDDSRDAQDVALAVRKPLRVVGFEADLDADDQHFLFPGSQNDWFFPRRRDVLVAEVELPGEAGSFHVLVQHAKSRFGGRATTDPRREGAAIRLVEVLKQDFDGKDFILLGDFNDNPDDRSLNILETGHPDTPGGMESVRGPFLINLSEPLAAAGHVSHGRTSGDIEGGRINTVDPGSRERNDRARGTNAHTGDILFDQILIPAWMADKYVEGSAKVFDDPVAVEGNNRTRASDHLPVVAEFVFGDEDATASTPVTGVRIVSALPNPAGGDAGHEAVTIGNFDAGDLDLGGWELRDRANNRYALSGTVPRGDRRTLVMETNSMPLNNGGDEIRLIDPNGRERDRVSYSGTDAASGHVVEFLPAAPQPEPTPEPSPAPTDLEVYYTEAAGKTGAELKGALHGIIKGHRRYSYREVWQILMDVDEDPNNPNNVVLLYTGRSQPKDQNSGQDSANPDYWNREHVWAKSHGFPNQSQLAYTDVHHLRPADMSVNSSRSSKDFDNGGSRHREATGCRSDRDSWEPRDGVKGDVARMMFYMAVRYEGDDNVPDLEVVNRTGTSGPQFGKLCTLYKWHYDDPVDSLEKGRNDKVYVWQANRNPFIDHPEWVQSIWGGQCPAVTPH